MSGTILSHSRISLTVITAISVAMAIGCSKPNIRVLPERAAPGDAVLITGAQVQNAIDVSVEIGGKKAIIIRMTPDGIEAMVPKIDPAVVKVTLRAGQRQLGQSQLEIIPSPMRRLFLTIERGSVELKDVQPYNGQYDRFVSRGRRLSYDVVTEKGEVIYTNAIRHPEPAQLEVHQRDKIRRVPAKGPVPFLLKIPYHTSVVTVRLYNAEDADDLATAAGRNARSPITDFTIP